MGLSAQIKNRACEMRHWLRALLARQKNICTQPGLMDIQAIFTSLTTIYQYHLQPAILLTYFKIWQY